MSAQSTIDGESTTYNPEDDNLGGVPTRSGWHARVMERMSVDEFDALLSGELDPDEWLQRHDLAGGADQ